MGLGPCQLFFTSVRRDLISYHLENISNGANFSANDTLICKNSLLKQPDITSSSNSALGPLATLFSVKSRLDFAGVDNVACRPLELPYANYLTASLPVVRQPGAGPNKFILALEHSLYNDSLYTLNSNPTMAKLTISENSLKSNNSDLFLSLNTQNSIEYAFNLASSNR